MPVAYLTIPGLRARVKGERLELELPPAPGVGVPSQRWIPLSDLERVVVDGSARLSNHAIGALLDREIPVLFTQHGNFPAGLAVPLRRSNHALAYQLDACRDAAYRLSVAQELVAAKIRNMRRVLQRLSANRGQPALASAWLNAIANQAKAAASLDSLRGLEGAASGRYFETLAPFFPATLPFERRSRRPPKNPANALLSFGYTLLVAEVSLHLHAIGLEPSWGFLHEAEPGRPALALDLIEPYRAPVVDALTLDLLNHGRLKEEDFEASPEGGWLLTRLSRRTVYAAWEERLEREFHYEAGNTRTSLRGLIAHQCRELKACFEQRTLPKPFHMN